MIAIIDYDMGNLGSIKNMIKKLGGESIVTNNIEIISNASGIILPGVGSFDTGVDNLKKYNLFELIKEMAVSEKKPLLGICLGMQLLTNMSEEGGEKGLGLVNAETIKFKDDINRKIPHMGWNIVEKSNSSVLLKNFVEPPRFYFVHSYFVKCNEENDVVGRSEYGQVFDSIFEKGNIMGVQFHPEKSHRFGMSLMEGFLKLVDSNE
jgi:glutamine amidotransferase